MRRLKTAVLVVLLMATALRSADPYELTRSSTDSGGMTIGTAGTFEVFGAVSPANSSDSASGGEFDLTGGFWFPLLPGDCNIDGGVDLVDYARFHLCLTGPVNTLRPDCECFDIDDSGTVDLRDFASTQLAHAGS